MKTLHIGFHETMSGYYWDPLSPKLAGRCRCAENSCCSKKAIPVNLDELSSIETKKFEFTVDATAPIPKFVNSKSEDFMLTKLEGVVTMEDICEDLEIRNGELLLDFFGNQELVYSFDFEAEGSTFYYQGQKELSLKHPLYSMTTLGGEIYEKENGRLITPYLSECKFDLKDLPRFLFSFLQSLKVK